MKRFLADGRVVRYWSSATDGPVVLVFHGCPDTRRVAMTGEPAAHEVGVRLLAFNRPGYGSSTPTDSTHTTVARDAADLLDGWGIEQVAVLGMSVGGPYAAAFAASYAERTTSLALVAAPAMPDAAPDGTVEESMARMAPEFLAWRARIGPDDEDDEALAARFLAELPQADAALLAAYGSGLVGGLAWEALVEPEGYLRDAALLTRPWDFAVADVRCPATVWVGGDDEKAMAAAPWWSDRLPQSVLEVAPDTTHLGTLLTQWPAILRRLAADHRRGTG